jgi:hypothetical protein
MTAHLPRLPFSLDPLIAEAKRRARQRRLLLAVVCAVAALAVGGAVFATRSAAPLVAGPPAPGCPAHTGAGDSSLASGRTRTAAAQRDEERLLCLVVVPQGSQLVTSEPHALVRLGRIVSFPKPYAPFARHRFWRIHSSVTALVNFEKAHPPAGSQLLGCEPDAAADCGVGDWSGPNVPANASLTFPLPPIRGRVGSRVLTMTILGLPDGWTAFRVDAVNRPWTRGA